MSKQQKKVEMDGFIWAGAKEEAAVASIDTAGQGLGGGTGPGQVSDD